MSATSKRLAVILFVVHLAVEVRGGCWFPRKRPVAEENNAEADFWALDKYLTRRVQKTDSSGANVAYLDKHIQHLKGSAKEAGLTVLELAREHARCNGDLLYMLSQVRQAGLSPVGSTRIEKVMRTGLEEATRVCTKYVEQSYGKANNLMLTRFVSIFSPVTVNGHGGKYFTISDQDVPKYVARLAREDGKGADKGPTSASVAFESKAKFELALFIHLLVPCEKLVNKQYFRSHMLASARADSQRSVPFTSLARQLDLMDWRIRSCNRLMQLDTTVIDGLFRYALKH